MSIVYILGAGASYGDDFKVLENAPEGAPVTETAPPLTSGFFARSLYDSLRYPGMQAEEDFPEVFDYIRWLNVISDQVGEGLWSSANLEDIFTAIELRRQFSNPESDNGARLQIIRNKLIRYIWRIIGLATVHKYGVFSKKLVEALQPDDSLITFNWDLLLDQELWTPTGPPLEKKQYLGFFSGVLKDFSSLQGNHYHLDSETKGLFLKLHGSLNWVQCTNPGCPGWHKIELDEDSTGCLNRAIGIHVTGEYCKRCGSDTIPLLIPPLLHKPVLDNWIFRSIWGLAHKRLEEASTVVVVGFSAAPTDFYAAWLLRSSVGLRKEANVFVVNPSNIAGTEEHSGFANRMGRIFPHGYNSDFYAISQLDEIMRRVTENGLEGDGLGAGVP